MLFRLIKKITKNYGVFLALFFGIIISLVMINSTIIYGNSLKNSLFQHVLKEYEKDNNKTAGTILIHKEGVKVQSVLSDNYQKDNKSRLSGLGLNIIEGRTEIVSKDSLIWYEENDPFKDIKCDRGYTLKAIENFRDHITVVQGRKFKNTFEEDDKNVVEVMIDKKTMINMKLELDKLYRMELTSNYGIKDLKSLIELKLKNNKKMNYFKIVGVYELKENDLFWREGYLKNNENTFMIHEKSMELLSVNEKKSVQCSSEYFIDFSDYKYSDLENLKSRLELVNKDFIVAYFDFKSNIGALFDVDNENFRLVGNMLWFIQIPVLAILFLYILMITGIIVDRDKDQIALLKSRGATEWKIIINYFFDGFIILIIGLAVTPILSGIATKWMSTVSGFMEFKGDYQGNMQMSLENIYYSLITGLIFLGALLIPVIKASKDNIVDRKNSKVRISFSSWKKFYIDFIFTAIGAYGFISFVNSQKSMENLDIDINTISLDPIIFLSATVLAFGLSLLFLRLYPLLIKGILGIFKKIMPAHIFVLFSNLSRKAGKREYTMLFIMILISSSIFNLKIARTINTNIIDNIKYSAGADVRIKGEWLVDSRTPTKSPKEIEHAYVADVLTKTELIEPDFEQYRNLDSLESTAKVMKVTNVEFQHSRLNLKHVNVIAIQPKEFGETAYMRDDLTPFHWFNYLNVLAEQPEVVFLSSNFKQEIENNMEIGDLIELNVYEYKEKFIFGGYIDYWPSFDKNIVEHGETNKIVIGNFNRFYSRIVRVPYEVWGRLKEGKDENDLLAELREKSVSVKEIKSISDQTRENVFLKAVNSSITNSFILSMIVTLLGFLIYWCICIRERELQFGILRSLGLKMRKIYSMIFIEQLLITGVSLVVGIGIGEFISEKYLRIITEIIFGNKLMLPVIQYIASSDYLLIILIFIISVIFVLVLILKYISDIKLNQAIKIGED